MAVEENAQDEEVPQSNEEEPKVVRVDFNPMISYVEMAFGIFAIYSIYYVLGLEVFMIASLSIVIFIIRETYYVYTTYPSGFVRNGSVFNAFHSVAWFVVLAINISAILQFGAPVILPELANFTELSALFILMAFFGTRNIVRMYVPSSKLRDQKSRYPL
ncbi:MAG: hypothetical protein ACTSUB_04775 [Candidatus Thorarchaeota archaeon]